MKNILIVGSGIFGSVCAYELHKMKYRVLVLEKKDHIGGFCYTNSSHNIIIHKYGAHIFHTKNKKVWDYINKFAIFNNYIHKVYSSYKGIIYSLPFNLLTYQQVFGSNYSIPLLDEEKNILFDMFIKNYSEKHWKRDFNNIPKYAVARLPIKYTYNNDYFENHYQGIPIGGYTQIFQNMLKNIDVKTNTKYILDNIENDIIFTGCIDELFDYRFGKLDYRSLKFEEEYIPESNDYQHNSVINYPDKNIPFTRIVEHKHFEFNTCNGTIITIEYPIENGEPCYPINDDKNDALYKKYLNYANTYYPNIKFGGRLGSYVYMDIDKTIEKALELIRNNYESI